MKPTGSVQNLQRTRKQMCLMSTGEQSTTPEHKRSKFDEMVERLGNETVGKSETQHRRTKSEICLVNGVQKPQNVSQLQDEDFFITEIIADDATPLYLNKNDTKSEEFTI